MPTPIEVAMLLSGLVMVLGFKRRRTAGSVRQSLSERDPAARSNVLT
ncbi:MAG: hypothetical protein ABI343_04810 [Burkholderiaceae bacterium]